MAHTIEGINNEFELALVPGSIKRHLNSKNGVSSSDLFKIKREMVHVLDGYNVRFMDSPSYKAKVRSIADLMKKHGWLPTEPISGYVAHVDGADVFYLTKGHTRLDAYDLAISEGAVLGEIPAIAHPRMTTMLGLDLDLHFSNNSEKLSPLSLGKLCQRLMTVHHMTVQQVCESLQESEATITKAIALYQAPEELKQLVIQEKVAATVAYDAIKQYGLGAYEYLSKGIERASAAGKAKATGKHFDSKSWNRRLIESRVNDFRNMQKLKGYTDEDLLPEDPLEALQMLLMKVYPDMEEDAKTLSLPAPQRKAALDKKAKDVVSTTDEDI